VDREGNFNIVATYSVLRRLYAPGASGFLFFACEYDRQYETQSSSPI